MNIPAPSGWEDIDAIRFIQKLQRFKDELELMIDIRSLRFVHPFATLLIAIAIRDLLSYRDGCGLRKPQVCGYNGNNEAHTYLKHVGFFQFIGIDEGKRPNEARGSARYLPITILSEQQFREDNVRLQNAIKQECERLAKIIYSDNCNESRAVMLEYCLRETVRNVFEHAEVSKCYLMAQRWNNGFAEIAIADEGIGIFDSLKKSHSVATPDEALTLALQPGISSNPEPENDDEWQNSGFGLFILSELGRKGDSKFTIASNNRILRISEIGQCQDNVPLSGTVVKLRVNTTESEYFPNVLHNIVEDGEKRAKLIPGARVAASKKSKLVNLTW